MSSLTVGWSPQTGQSGFLRNRSSRNFIRRASKTSRRPTRVSPFPRRTLMASIAWIDPTIPGRTPRTPPSAHEGTRPGGGGPPDRARKQGPLEAPKTAARPFDPQEGGGVEDLRLQVCEVNHVKVHDAEAADAGGGEVLRERVSEPSGADDQGGRLLEPDLALHADLGQDQVTRVALNLLRRQPVLPSRGEEVHRAEQPPF